MNLLDRCDKPISMLKHMYRLVKPGGLILIALVLPFEPFVEKGNNLWWKLKKINSLLLFVNSKIKFKFFISYFNVKFILQSFKKSK